MSPAILAIFFTYNLEKVLAPYKLNDYIYCISLSFKALAVA
ncbi:hypothetical protein EDD66_11287 [Mobilisporobacter senegalensis]|uniref:Uncharacterized protein n=1 Tax=Mobilisporobacter senegalensis TaxID=1329262 RepID=A0A3N1XB30_9FIRM|nr:hypothetical protein EDD66_11287 [Mobilisporobacter senegalensis]